MLDLHLYPIPNRIPLSRPVCSTTLGGEPLANSGFEAEEPEPDFEERS